MRKVRTPAEHNACRALCNAGERQFTESATENNFYNAPQERCGKGENVR